MLGLATDTFVGPPFELSLQSAFIAMLGLSSNTFMNDVLHDDLLIFEGVPLVEFNLYAL